MIVSQAVQLTRDKGDTILGIERALLSAVDIRRDVPVYVYHPKSENKNRPLQLFITSLKLSHHIVLCRMEMTNVPGQLRKVVDVLAQMNVNIKKTNDTTIGRLGIVEMVLDIEGCPHRYSGLEARLMKLFKQGVIANKPRLEMMTGIIAKETFQQVLPTDFHLAKESGQLKINSKFFETKGISSSDQHKMPWAVLSAYSRVPVIVASIYPFGFKLLNIELEHVDKPGSLDAILLSLNGLGNLIASDLVTYSADLGRWIGYVSVLDGHNAKEIEVALHGCDRVMPDTVKVQLLGWAE